MSFIRKKTIKGKEYAYLVINNWTRNGCRQKVGKYLGKIIKCEKLSNEPHSLIKETYHERILELIQHELTMHGFGKQNDKWTLNDITVCQKVLKNNKNIVLQLNEGFLCEDTIKQLIEFVPKTEIDLQRLASLLVETGIKINEQVFLQLCEPIIAKEKEKESANEQFYY